MTIVLNELNKLAFELAPIFYKLLFMSVAALCIGIVILYLRRFSDNRISPFWKRAMWLLVLICLTVPYRVRSNTALLNNVEQLQNISFRASYDRAKAARHDFLESSEQTPENQKEYEKLQSNIRIVYWQSLIFDTAVPLVWILALLIIVVFTAAGRVRLSYLLNNHKTGVSERYYTILKKCKVRLGIKTDISITVQDYLGSPALLGVIRPKIILPAYINDMDDDKVEYILLHELAHFKRFDMPYNYLLIVLQAVYWFNPLIWIMFRFIRQDMELANDAFVLKQIGNENAKQYSASLVEVLARYSNIPFVPKLLCMVDGRDNMERRIKMIKLGEVFKKRRFIIAAGSIVIIAITAAVFLTTANGADKNGVPDLYAHITGLSTKLQTGTYGWDYGYKKVQSDSMAYYEMDYSEYGSFTMQQQQDVKVYIKTQKFFKDKTKPISFDVISIEQYNADKTVVLVDDYVMDGGDLIFELPNEAGVYFYGFTLKFKNGTVHYGLRIETKNNSSDTDYMDVSMLLQSADSSGVKFIFKNNSDNEYTYGSDYTLLTFKNGVWEGVPYIIENWGFDALGYILAPQSQSDEITVDWRWLYGELQDGVYKLQKDILFVRKPGDYDTLILEVDFTLINGKNEYPPQTSEITFR